MIDNQDFHEEEDDEKTCELEQSARIHPGSSTLPTADGRSEVGCKSLKCGAGQAKPALCCMMQAVADPQHLGRFIEQREKLFLLEGAWNGYSSAIAAMHAHSAIGIPTLKPRIIGCVRDLSNKNG